MYCLCTELLNVQGTINVQNDIGYPRHWWQLWQCNVRRVTGFDCTPIWKLYMQGISRQLFVVYQCCGQEEMTGCP